MADLTNPNQNATNPFGAVAGEQNAPNPLSPSYSVPYAQDASARTPEDLQARIDRLQSANVTSENRGLDLSGFAAPSTIQAPAAPQFMAPVQEEIPDQTMAPLSVTEQAPEMSDYEIVTSYVNDERVPHQDRAKVYDAVFKQGKSIAGFAKSLRMGKYSPKPKSLAPDTKEESAYAKYVKEDMFQEEKDAFDRMVAKGVSEGEAFKRIQNKWKELIGETTEKEKDFLKAMREKGISVDAAVTGLRNARQEASWANESAENMAKAVAKRVLVDLPMTAGGEIFNSFLNLAGAVGVPGAQEYAKASEEDLARSGMMASGIGTLGKFMGDAAMSVAATPSKLILPSGSAATMAGRAGQAIPVGAAQGSIIPFMNKGAETKPEEVLSSTLEGGVTAGLGVPVIEKAIGTVGKGLGYLALGIGGLKAGGFKGAGKAIADQLSMDEKAVREAFSNLGGDTVQGFRDFVEGLKEGWGGKALDKRFAENVAKAEADIIASTAENARIAEGRKEAEANLKRPAFMEGQPVPETPTPGAPMKPGYYGAKARAEAQGETIPEMPEYQAPKAVEEPEEPKFGQAVEEEAPTAQEEKLIRQIEGETAKGIFNGKVVDVPVPEKTLMQRITAPMRTNDTKVLIGRAIAPRSVGVNAKPARKVKLYENTEKDFREYHGLVRSGELQGDISSLESAAESMVRNLEEVGGKIGEEVDKLQGVPPQGTDILGKLNDEMERVLTDTMQSDAAAFSVLSRFSERVRKIRNWKDVKTVRQNFRQEVTKLYKSDNAGTDSYKVLERGVQALTDALEEAVGTQAPSSQYVKYKQQYALMKRLIGDIAQSALVESRRAPMTLTEQLSFLEALSRPTEFVKQAFVKEMAELNTRGGAYKEAVRLMDEEGIKAYKKNPIQQEKPKTEIPKKTETKPEPTIKVPKKPEANTPVQEPKKATTGRAREAISELSKKAPQVDNGDVGMKNVIREAEKEAAKPKVPGSKNKKSTFLEYVKERFEDMTSKKQGPKNRSETYKSTFDSLTSNGASKETAHFISNAIDYNGAVSASHVEYFAKKDGIGLGPIERELVKNGFRKVSQFGEPVWIRPPSLKKGGFIAGRGAADAPKPGDTRWWSGPDGKERFQISDKDATVAGVPKQDVAKFDEMYRNIGMAMDAQVNNLSDSELVAKYGKTSEQITESLEDSFSQRASDGKEMYDYYQKVKNAKTVGDILEHPELYKQYPELRNVRLNFDHIVDRNGKVIPIEGGTYVSKDAEFEEQIGISLDSAIREYAGKGEYAGRKEHDRIKIMLLHEIQHSIQTREGFALGGGPSTGKALREKRVAEIKSKIESVKKKMDEVETMAGGKKTFNDLIYGTDEQIAKIRKDKSAELAKMTELSREMLYLEQQAMYFRGLDDYEAYRALYGEMEANRVMQQMDMSQSQLDYMAKMGVMKEQAEEDAAKSLILTNPSNRMESRFEDRKIKKIAGLAKKQEAAQREKFPEGKMNVPLSEIEPEVRDFIASSKGMSAEDIMAKRPDIRLKNDVVVKDVHGEKSVIKEGEVLTPYEVKGNKVILQDGKTYLVSKNSFENIKGNSQTKESGFNPKMSGLYESVKGKAKPKYPKKSDVQFVSSSEEDVAFSDNKMKTEIYSVGPKNGQQSQVNRYVTVSKDGKIVDDVAIVEFSPGGKMDGRIFKSVDEAAKELESAQSQSMRTEWHDYVQPGEKSDYREIVMQAEKPTLSKSSQKPVSFEKEFKKSKNGKRVAIVKFSDGKEWGFSPDENWLEAAMASNGIRNVTKIDTPEEIFEVVKKLLDYLPTYKNETHWGDMKNPLAHIRLTQRKGGSYAFLEEIQSDWSREHSSWAKGGNKHVEMYFNSEVEKWVVNTGLGKVAFDSKTDAQLFAGRIFLQKKNQINFPYHEALEDWKEIALRRALQDAVDSGAEKFAWANSYQVQKQFKLGIEINRLRVDKDGKNFSAGMQFQDDSGDLNIAHFTFNDDNVIISSEDYPELEGMTIGKIFGEENVEKIRSNKFNPEEGMSGFIQDPDSWAIKLYDDWLPKAVERITGIKPVQEKILEDGRMNYSIPLTDKLKKRITGEGFEKAPKIPGKPLPEVPPQKEPPIMYSIIRDSKKSTPEKTIRSTVGNPLLSEPTGEDIEKMALSSLRINVSDKAAVRSAKKTKAYAEAVKRAKYHVSFAKKNGSNKGVRPGQPDKYLGNLMNDDVPPVARERFDIPNLLKIGEGSDRVAFELPDGNVLKVAKTARGLAQNAKAMDWYLQSEGVIPECFENGANYIVVERVKHHVEWTTEERKKVWDFIDVIESAWSEVKYNTKRPDLMYQKLDSVGMGVLGDYNWEDLGWGDMVRPVNIGIKNGNPIFLDEGFMDLKKTMKDYENIAPRGTKKDPEYEAIKKTSKEAKKAFGDVDRTIAYSIPEPPKSAIKRYGISENEAKTAYLMGSELAQSLSERAATESNWRSLASNFLSDNFPNEPRRVKMVVMDAMQSAKTENGVKDPKDFLLKIYDETGTFGMEQTKPVSKSKSRAQQAISEISVPKKPAKGETPGMKSWMGMVLEDIKKDNEQVQSYKPELKFGKDAFEKDPKKAVEKMRKQFLKFDLEIPTSEKDIPKLEEVLDEVLSQLQKRLEQDYEARKILEKTPLAENLNKKRILEKFLDIAEREKKVGISMWDVVSLTQDMIKNMIDSIDTLSVDDRVIAKTPFYGGFGEYFAGWALKNYPKFDYSYGKIWDAKHELQFERAELIDRLIDDLLNGKQTVFNWTEESEIKKMVGKIELKLSDDFKKHEMPDGPSNIVEQEISGELLNRILTTYEAEVYGNGMNRLAYFLKKMWKHEQDRNMIIDFASVPDEKVWEKIKKEFGIEEGSNITDVMTNSKFSDFQSTLNDYAMGRSFFKDKKYAQAYSKLGSIIQKETDKLKYAKEIEIIRANMAGKSVYEALVDELKTKTEGMDVMQLNQYLEGYENNIYAQKFLGVRFYDIGGALSGMGEKEELAEFLQYVSKYSEEVRKKLVETMFPDVRTNGERATLTVLHNIPIGKLEKLMVFSGGKIPSPSLAITRGDIPFESFGEITLVGDRKMIEGLKSNIYEHDAFTARFPKSKRVISETEGAKKTVSSLRKLWEKAGLNPDLVEKEFFDFELKFDKFYYSSFKGMSTENPYAMIAFLTKKGEEVGIHQYSENAEGYAKQIKNEGLIGEYVNWYVKTTRSVMHEIFSEPEKNLLSKKILKEYAEKNKEYDLLKEKHTKETNEFMKSKASEEEKQKEGDRLIEQGKKLDDLAKEINALHDQANKIKMTPAKAVKAMHGKGSKGVESGSDSEIRSFSGFIGIAGRKMKTPEDVWQLKYGESEELDDLRRNFDRLTERLTKSEYLKIARHIIENSENSDSEIIKLAKEKGIYNSDMEELLDILRTAQDEPRTYSEAKPERVVDIKEFLSVIVPEEEMERVKGLLKGTGLENKIVGYSGSETGTRLTKLRLIREKYGKIFFAIGGMILPLSAIMQNVMNMESRKREA